MMLKIKDNVDLKEIGCDISDDEFDQIWSYKELLFYKDTRIIYPMQFNTYNELIEKRILALYDLIKADLVEKVGEE